MSLTSDTIVLEGDAPEAVSWAAIIAGAIAAISLTAVLAALGMGMGLTAISPWGYSGVGTTTFAVSSAIWLVVMQWLASAMGGYLAGRLRTRATGTLGDETYFRDTAHGFLAWAVATLIIAVVAGSSSAGLLSNGASAIGSVAGSTASGAAQAAASQTGSVPTGYFVDMLFRPAQNAPAPVDASTQTSGDGQAAIKSEATQIVATDIASGTWSAPDKAQLAHLIAVRTGMAEADAQHRVDDVIAQLNTAKAKVQQAADTARKVGLTFAFMTALSLVIGAFIASAAGALGGHRRDEV